VDFTAGVLPGSVRMNLEIEAAPMEQLRFSLLLALCRLDIADGGLAGAAILLGIEGDLLALDQPTHPGALERGGMDENVLATIVRLNEAEAFLIIVELHGARIHRNILSLIEVHLIPRRACARPETWGFDVWRV